jgi:hypothetical protein
MEIFQKILLNPLFSLKNAEKSTKKYVVVPNKLFAFTRIVEPD